MTHENQTERFFIQEETTKNKSIELRSIMYGAKTFLTMPKIT